MTPLRFILLGSGLLTATSAISAPKKTDKPNIIYIMCDDMGYGDLACYGQKYISTPNIDRMATEGMLFTQAYAGKPRKRTVASFVHDWAAQRTLRSKRQQGVLEERAHGKIWHKRRFLARGTTSLRPRTYHHPRNNEG